MDNYEKLLADPRVENCHPKFIAVVDGKKEFVAEVIDGIVYLTDAGRKLLAETPVPEAEKPARKPKKVAAEVQSTDTLAPDFGDLDLNG